MTENTVKQVIVVRKDLNMRKGKMIAQGAHASMGAIISGAYKHDSDLDHSNNIMIPLDVDLDQWLSGAFTKIALCVNSEEELLTLHRVAIDKGLRHFLVRDSGKTEFDGVPTYTSLAIGPAKNEVINEITGHLKLL